MVSCLIIAIIYPCPNKQHLKYKHLSTQIFYNAVFSMTKICVICLFKKNFKDKCRLILKNLLKAASPIKRYGEKDAKNGISQRINERWSQSGIISAEKSSISDMQSKAIYPKYYRLSNWCYTFAVLRLIGPPGYYFKGVSSKCSGNHIVAPNFCLLS